MPEPKNLQQFRSTRIYARARFLPDGDEASLIEAQLTVVLGLCGQHRIHARSEDALIDLGWGATDTWMEDSRGKSKEGLKSTRPAFSELIREIMAGRVDTVVVSHWDRLSRSRDLSEHLIALFKRHGVKVVTCSGVFNSVDATSPLTIEALFANCAV